MTKTILLATIAAVMVLGLATASVVINNNVEAGVGGDMRTPVRDNVDVENIKLKNGQVRAIVDNAGIGATSDVEITWWFNPEKCVVIAAGDVGGFGTVELVNDGAFTDAGIPVGHNDVKWAEAILLGVKGDAKECKIDSKKGEYVAVSTVAMGPPGMLLTSNPP